LWQEPYAYPLYAWAIIDGHRLLAVLPGKTYCRAHPIVNRIGLFLDRLRILHQSWDLNFPWMTLGNGFATSHKWIQWYEYTGVYGGTIWIWAINILLFLLYVGLREGQAKQIRLRLITGFALVLILPLGLSLFKYYGYKEQINPSNIVVAQPNIDPYEKEGTIPVAVQIATLTRLSDSIGQKNTEYFIWPETAIPEDMDEDRIYTDNYYLQVRGFLNKYKNANVLTGGETHKFYTKRATKTASPMPDQPGIFYDRFSTAINIENSSKVQFYHKSRLVPGAESLPFGNTLSFLKPRLSIWAGPQETMGYKQNQRYFIRKAG
jgi:apolipoprotein N-acyltransferase